MDGGQGEYVRAPLADGTLVTAPVEPDDSRTTALLALSDVMGTGHHAAASAGAGPGTTIAVIGDGAVGLCAVLAAARLGADRVILLSTHADRAALGTKFGQVAKDHGRATVGGGRERGKAGCDVQLGLDRDGLQVMGTGCGLVGRRIGHGGFLAGY